MSLALVPVAFIAGAFFMLVWTVVFGGEESTLINNTPPSRMHAVPVIQFDDDETEEKTVPSFKFVPYVAPPPVFTLSRAQFGIVCAAAAALGALLTLVAGAIW